MTFPPPTVAKCSESSLDMDYIDTAMSFTPSERCTVSCGTVCIDPRASKVLIIFNRRLGIWQLPKGRKNMGEGLQAAALRETYEETGVHADLVPLRICTRSTVPLVSPTGSTACNKSSVASSCTPTSNAFNGPRKSKKLSEDDGQSIPVADIGRPRSTSCPASTPRMITCPSMIAGSAPPTTPTAEDGAQEGSQAMQASIRDPKLTCHVFNSELIGVVHYPDLQAVTPNTIKMVFFYAAFADSTAVMGTGAQEDHEDLSAEWVDFRVAGDRLRFESEKEAVWKVRQDMERSGLKC